MGVVSAGIARLGISQASLSQLYTVTNLVISNITTSGASVSWSAPASGTGFTYLVETSINGGASWSTAAASPASSPVALTGLPANTLVEVRVTATSGALNGAVVISFLTASVVPGAVTSLANASLTASGATITWFPPTTGTSPFSYKLETSVDGGTTFTTVSTAATSPYVLNSFAQGQAVVVRVSAGNAAGYGATSTTSFTTLAAPGPVRNLAVGSIAATGASVSWTAPATGNPAAYTYLVELSSNGGASYASLSATATSPYALTGLTASTSYIVRLSAENSVGYGTTTLATFTTSASSGGGTDDSSLLLFGFTG